METVTGGGGSEASETGTEPVQESTETTVETAPESGTETQAETQVEAAPEWDWTAWDAAQWDGSVDSFPEDQRAAVTAMQGHFNPKLEANTGEIGELKSVLEALTFNEEDPRIATLSSELTGFKSQAEAANALAEAAQRELQQYQTEVTTSYMTNFQAKNPHIFQGDESVAQQEKLLEYVDAGTDMEIGAMVMQESAEYQKIFIGLKQGGLSDQASLDFTKDYFSRTAAAKAEEAAKVVPKPRESAALVSSTKTTQSAKPQIKTPAARGMQGFRAQKDAVLSKYFT